jgi:hypothetical protein
VEQGGEVLRREARLITEKDGPEARQPHAHAAFVGFGHRRCIHDDAKRQRAGQSGPRRESFVPTSHGQIEATAAWLRDLIELGQAVSTMAMQAVAHDFLPVWLLGHVTSVIIHKRI